MNTITVNKTDLLVALVANMETHAATVAQARDIYRERIIAELDKRLAEAKTGDDIDPGFLHRLPIPRDFTEDYVRAVEQVKWEVGDTVTLTPGDFNRYILDEWEWGHQFEAATASYLTK